jgi:hypothetical protein
MIKASLGLVAAVVLTASVAGVGQASAAPFGGTAAPARAVGLVDKVDYVYGGHGYCWYYDGWHGPGWYWCGYAWRRGLGWGSPVWGWNGWAWSGPRYNRGGGRPIYRGPVHRGPVGHGPVHHH